MRNNAFKFGNTFYRQKNGVAIGVPPASDMATQFFAFYKMMLLNPIYHQYLKVDVRYLDDKFGI